VFLKKITFTRDKFWSPGNMDFQAEKNLASNFARSIRDVWGSIMSMFTITATLTWVTVRQSLDLVGTSTQAQGLVQFITLFGWELGNVTGS